MPRRGLNFLSQSLTALQLSWKLYRHAEGPISEGAVCVADGGSLLLMAAENSAKQKIPEAEASGNLLEVTTRFELVDEGFADPCLTTWPRHHIGSDEYHSNGAADEARTRYLHLGKVALYQMSYGRIFGAFYLAPVISDALKNKFQSR